MLRENRAVLSPVEKDRIKQRAMRAAATGRPTKGFSMRARLTMVAVVVLLLAFSGGAIALTGGLGGSGNAATAQYGNGQNGSNGTNGFNGANGQNGAPGSSTIVTIYVPVAAPLPGTAKPTPANKKLIRVCKRYPHRSAKFHGHVFHPKVCWFRYV